MRYKNPVKALLIAFAILLGAAALMLSLRQEAKIAPPPSAVKPTSSDAKASAQRTQVFDAGGPIKSGPVAVPVHKPESKVTPKASSPSRPRPEIELPEGIQRTPEQQREWETALDILDTHLPKDKVAAVTAVLEDVCLERRTTPTTPIPHGASADEWMKAAAAREQASSLRRLTEVVTDMDLLTQILRPKKLLRHVYRACPYKEIYD